MAVLPSPAGEDTHAGARHFLTVVERLGSVPPAPRLLIAGCGAGHEAAFLARELGGPTSAIDVRIPDAPPEGCEFLQASADDLPFPDEEFDLVFFHHVIEHVPDPEAALDELARVMRPGAWIYVGTPNRHRMIGYLGSFDATIRDRIEWNLADYRARVRGRFRNELGAHAGFTEAALRGLLEARFTDVGSLTRDYFRFKYGRFPSPAVRAALAWPAVEVVPPSVYALARRGT